MARPWGCTARRALAPLRLGAASPSGLKRRPAWGSRARSIHIVAARFYNYQRCVPYARTHPMVRRVGGVFERSTRIVAARFYNTTLYLTRARANTTGAPRRGSCCTPAYILSIAHCLYLSTLTARVRCDAQPAPLASSALRGAPGAATPVVCSSACRSVHRRFVAASLPPSLRCRLVAALPPARWACRRRNGQAGTGNSGSQATAYLPSCRRWQQSLPAPCGALRRLTAPVQHPVPPTPWNLNPGRLLLGT